MGIQTTYTCDCCSVEQDTPKQMWKIWVEYSSAEGWSQNPSKEKEQLWCRKCMEKQAILHGDSNPTVQTPPVSPPTLEEIIREIICEEIDHRTGA